MQPNETEPSQKKQRVVIVGAGCFGLSTAYYLLGGDNESASPPRYTVTVIDSSPTVPAPDAASSDINKVVRSTYADGFYTGLAKDAIALWKGGRMCGKENYHEYVTISPRWM
jgi:sarcosine oxidase/L-pipecolate oxidase